MRIIGLMSGTSADGIDAALCEIDGTPPTLTATIVKAITHPYPDGLQARILAACLPASSSVDELARLNAALGEHFAAAALSVIAQAGLTPADVDLIGSHGQTVWHNVEGNGKVSATLQIGEAAFIAERTGISKSKVYDMLNRGDMRSVKIDGQKRVPVEDYLFWRRSLPTS